jgi:hypothetical protein
MIANAIRFKKKKKESTSNSIIFCIVHKST